MGFHEWLNNLFETDVDENDMDDDSLSELYEIWRTSV